jgi:hypothetical protein
VAEFVLVRLLHDLNVAQELERLSKLNVEDALTSEEFAKGAVERMRRNEQKTKNVRLKYERTYVVIRPHELTRGHERSKTEEGG